MSEEWDEATAELHIGPDGKIRVFGLNETLMEVLKAVTGNDGPIERRRKLAQAARDRRDERADQVEPTIHQRADVQRDA